MNVRTYWSDPSRMLRLDVLHIWEFLMNHRGTLCTTPRGEHVHRRLASEMSQLARIFGGVLLPTALCAAGGDDPKVLVHRFTIDEPHEWVSIELRPTAALWHQRITGGPTARFDDVQAVLGSLEGIAIGARCAGHTQGSVHYPCAVDLDVRQYGATNDALGGWASTTTYKLTRPEDGTVSALSTPRPEPGSIALAGESGLLALVAPAAIEAQSAADRPLRVRVRLRPAPVADDGSGADAARPERATVFPAQGVIVISTQPLRPQPTRSASNGKQSVRLR